MSATRTFAALLTDVREEGDLEELDDRHSDAELGRFMNRSIARFRTKLAALGFTLNNTATIAAPLPTAPPVVGEQYLEVPFPAGAVGIYGFDVLSNGRWDPLKPGTFAERRDYVQRSTLGSSGPHTYVIQSVPQESGATTAAGKIQLYPLSGSGQIYKIWYLPTWVDIDVVANPTFVVYGHDGTWFDWLINDTIIRSAKKDDDSQNTYAIARDERAIAWEEIKRSAQNMNRAEPIRPVRRSRIR